VAAIRLLLSAILVGAAGFVCGYFGPLALNPESNQGPLLGLFITGPLSVLLGLGFGVVAALRPMSPARFATCLSTLAAAVGATTLYLALPEDRWQGFVIEAEVRDCRQPATAVVAAQDRWRLLNRDTPWRTPRPGWESEIPRMLQEDQGAVVTLYVKHRWDIYEQRKPWNRGNLHARNLHVTRPEQYFVRGKDCQSPELAIGRQIRSAPEWEPSSVSPPAILPTFLGLNVLKLVPASFERAISHPKSTAG
jgi:hypothetical protein